MCCENYSISRQKRLATCNHPDPLHTLKPWTPKVHFKDCPPPPRKVAPKSIQMSPKSMKMMFCPYSPNLEKNISLENSVDLQNFPRSWWVFRLKFSFSLEHFNPRVRSWEYFSIFGPTQVNGHFDILIIGFGPAFSGEGRKWHFSDTSQGIKYLPNARLMNDQQVPQKRDCTPEKLDWHEFAFPPPSNDVVLSLRYPISCDTLSGRLALPQHVAIHLLGT